MPTHTAAVEMASMSTTCWVTLGSLSYLSSFRRLRRRIVVHLGSARREDTMHPPTLPEAPSTAAANLPMLTADFPVRGELFILVVLSQNNNKRRKDFRFGVWIADG